MRGMLHGCLVLALLGVASVSAGAGAASLPAGTTAILSGDASLLAPLPVPVLVAGSFDPVAERGAVSADGRYVVFLTNVLALGASPAVSAAYVRRDMLTGATVPVSVTSTGTPMPLGSGPFVNAFAGAALSADGNRFAFEALGTAGGTVQVWVRDVAAGTTTLASVDRTNTGESAGVVLSPSISADGNRVAFGSNAGDLVLGDAGSDFDVFVRDLAAHTTTLASAADQGGVHGGVHGMISRDGAHVAFDSSVDNLVATDQNGKADVFVRDLVPGQAPRTRLASRSSAGASGNDFSQDPAVSADGSRVAFVSRASSLGTPVPLGSIQVWVHDFADGSTVLASQTPAGSAAGEGVLDEPPALSADGRVVAFASDSPDLVANAPADKVEVYRRDLAAHATQLVSRGQGPNGNPSNDDHQIAESPALSADGGCVVFDADADLLGPGAVNASVYMRVLEDDCGRQAPSTRPDGGAPPAAPDTTAPRLSAVSLSRMRFAVAARRRSGAPPRGSVLRFTTSEPGRVTVAIARVRRGHRAARRVATLARTAAGAGRGSVALSGRVAGKPLAPGRYRLTLTVRDAAGNASHAVRRGFTVLAG